MTKDSELMLNNDGPWYYEMIKLGYNYRLTDFQSALGSSQLKRLDKFIKKRRSIAKKYDDKLKSIVMVYKNAMKQFGVRRINKPELKKRDSYITTI